MKVTRHALSVSLRGPQSRCERISLSNIGEAG